jgi:hypothetical protein
MIKYAYYLFYKYVSSFGVKVSMGYLNPEKTSQPHRGVMPEASEVLISHGLVIVIFRE